MEPFDLVRPWVVVWPRGASFRWRSSRDRYDPGREQL